MKRFEDWERRLSTAINASRDKPFVWGRFDCCLFSCDMTAAMTGIDLAAPWRGAYSTEDEAWRIVDSFGGMEAFATSLLGAPLPRTALAQRGDGVLFDMARFAALLPGIELGRFSAAMGICLGARVALLGPSGLHAVPLRHCAAAWKV